MPGPEVPDADDIVVRIPPQRGDDALAGATVLGGVVQYVAQHLLQPFRIAGDRIGVQFAVVVILQMDAVLSEQLPIGVNGVLEPVCRSTCSIRRVNGRPPSWRIPAASSTMLESRRAFEDNVQMPGALSGDLSCPPAVSRPNH